MAEITRYQRVNPLACALAAGITELVFVLVIGWPMIGMGGGMMGGYGGTMHNAFGIGVVWWLGGAVVTGVAGAFFAWLYNATNR